MNNGMSVHELVEALLDAGDSGLDTYDPRIVELESALRRKVIEEARVGSIAIRKDPVDGFPMIDGLEVTRGDDLYSWHHYDLIPKETS